MAHNIQTMFVAGQPAWHGLGVVVDGAKTWQDAIKLASLDWTVTKAQLKSPLDDTLVDAYGIFRDDNWQMIGAVGSQYTPLQNEFAFNFVDAIMETEEHARYISAGALGNGEKIWCLAQIGEGFEVVPGDEHATYLLFASSHDGSMASTCKLTDIRVVCNNTLTQALSMKGTQTKVKHTKNGEAKLDETRSLVSNASTNIEKITEKLRELSKRKVKKDTLMSIMKRLYGDFEEQKRSENKVLQVLERYEFNDNNQFPQIRGTGYNLLNAITEYTDHFSDVRKTDGRKGRTENNIRAENAIFGNGAKQKEDALSIIMELTSGAERIPEVSYIDMSSGSLIDDIIGITMGCRL